MRNKDKNLSDQSGHILSAILDIVKRSDDALLDPVQEVILNIIWLATNTSFFDQITKARDDLNIPAVFYSPNEALDKDYLDKWTHQFSPKILLTSEKICGYFGLSPCELYDGFISNYFLHGGIYLPIKALGGISNQEQRYKAKLRFILPTSIDPINFNKYSLHLEIFKDSTQKKLIKFIKDNWEQIVNTQEFLEPYTHNKNFGYFKRDVTAYLYSLLGKTNAQIESLVNETGFYEEHIKTAIHDIRSIMKEKSKQGMA